MQICAAAPFLEGWEQVMQDATFLWTEVSQTSDQREGLERSASIPLCKFLACLPREGRLCKAVGIQDSVEAFERGKVSACRLGLNPVSHLGLRFYV